MHANLVSCLQLLSNALVFLCGSGVGAFHKVLMEKTLRQTFQDTLRCLSMRMKLEIEKRQQVCETHWRLITKWLNGILKKMIILRIST